MAFSDGHYGFRIELAHTDAGHYEKLWLKTAKHPHESLLHLAARVLAYCHSYQPEFTFSQGLFEPNEPTIWAQDGAGKVQSWVQVGEMVPKKLERAVRSHDESKFAGYFYDNEQVESFAHSLKGSKSDGIASVQFYRLEQEKLNDLIEILALKNIWEVTVADPLLFVTTEDIELRFTIDPIDVWAVYQRVIGNAE